MLTYCAVMLTLIFIGILYILIVVNNGFSVIKLAMESLEVQCKLLIVKCDKIVGKHDYMTRSIIEDIKGK